MTELLTQKAWTLIDHGHAAEASSLTQSAAQAGGATPNLLMAHAAALKALGRAEDAVAFNRRAVSRARKVLAMACRQHGLSGSEVGRFLNGRTRAAISYMVKSLEKELQRSPELRAQLEGLR